MKTKSNLLAMFLGALLLAVPDMVNAQFIFTTNNDGSLNLSQYTGPGGVVVIPATNDDLLVTSIGYAAFRYCGGLTNVTIPDSVTSIGQEAFFYCGSLTNIIIGSGVTNIGDYAFFDCNRLATITVDTNNPIYSSVTGVLFNKSQTTLIEYPMGGAQTYTIPNTVTSIGTDAFFDCSILTNITIGTSVTSIEDDAFGNCTYLTRVTIPNSVTNIGAYAFGGCGFTNLTIPNSVTSIGIQAFGGCYSLTNVTISTNLPSITSMAFYYCTNLVSVTVPNNVTNIGPNAFGYCGLTSVTIGASVSSIADFAFYGCSRLTGISFQGNAPSLGSAVFYGDNYAFVYYLPGTSGWSSPFGGRPAVMLNPPNPSGSLQLTLSPTAAITNGAQWQVDGGVAQPSGAIVSGLSVGNHTVSFSPVNGWAMPATQTVTVTANSTATASGTYGQLTYTTVNGAITLMGYYGPGNAIILPGTINGLPVTTIGADAFNTCASLTSVTIPNSISSIAGFAFNSCTSLKDMTIPNSVTNIADWAFAFCTSLTNMTIGSGVAGIGSEVFNNCTSLAAITVNANNPAYSSVAGVLFNKNQTRLIQYPFAGAGTYTVPNSVTNIGTNAFLHCAKLASITLDTNLTGIGSEAFFQCQLLTNVIFPKSVAYIGINAFYNCSRMRGFYFQGNAPVLGAFAFSTDVKAIVYYLPWTTGWPPPGSLFDACTTALWLPQAQTGNPGFGVQSNQFGFNMTWASDLVVVVEACTNLADPVWTPVRTNTLTGGSSYFSDPDTTNYPGRFYRLRSEFKN